MGFYVKNRALKSGTTSIVMPGGESVSRPGYPVPGQIRYNSDLCKLEYFNGAEFRAIAAEGRVELSVDSFVGDGSETTFVMSYSLAAANQALVFVGSIYQVPNEAYTVDGTDIEFTDPVPDGVPINVVHNLGSTVTEGCPVPPPPPNIDDPVPIYPIGGEDIDFGP